MTEKERRFEAEILAGRGGGAYVEIPFDVAGTYGTRGRVPIRTCFDGQPYRGSIAPMGGGKHVLGVPKAIRKAIGKQVGDVAEVVVVRDAAPRTVTIPPDLAAALARASGAKAAFDGLSYTCRKEYVRRVQEAKRPETRARRVRETVVEVEAGKRRR